MTENTTEVEIELYEEEWDMLEKCRVEFGFETLNDLVNHILKGEIEKEEKKIQIKNSNISCESQ